VARKRKVETRNQKLESRRQKAEKRVGRGRRRKVAATVTNKKSALGDFAGGFFEEFVDEGLVGFGLLGGHAAELAERS
jgi:hypothetical protein